MVWARATSACVAILMLSGIGGAIAHNLGGCLSMVRDDGSKPKCCALAGMTRIKRDRADYCEDPLLADADPTSTPSGGPEVLPSPVALAPSRAVSTAPAGLAPPRGAAVERPPDRSPPTRTTVLLI